MPSNQGVSFTDDVFYRPIEDALERKHGLPAGLLGDIRKKGERTNANVVSPAGARTVYQIMPAMQEAIFKRSGINAYAEPRQAAETAAMLLSESLNRNHGNVVKAVREYVGGTIPKNWGPVTNSYVARVTGQQPETLTISRAPTRDEVQYGNVRVDAYRLPREGKTTEELQAKLTAHSRLWDMVQIEQPQGPSLASLSTAVDATNQKAYEAEQAKRGSVADVAGAFVSSNWVSHQIYRGITEAEGKADPAWVKKFAKEQDKHLAEAASWDDWLELTGPQAMRSEQDFNIVKQRQASRKRREELMSQAGWAAIPLSIATSIVDIPAAVATGGLGKVLQVGKAAATGVKVANLAKNTSMGYKAAEGAALGLGFAGIAEYGGERLNTSDYLVSMVAGAGFGMLAHKLDSSAKPSRTDLELGAIANSGHEAAASLESRARIELGPEAEPAAVDTRMAEIAVTDIEKARVATASARPDNDRFLPSDPEALLVHLDPDPAVPVPNVEKHNLTGWSSREEQMLGVEIAERADRMVREAQSNGELAKGLEGRLLKAFGQESDALTLFRSGNPVAMSAAIQLLESTTGVGGRKPTAAISMVQHVRQFEQPLVVTDRAYDMWRKAQGIGDVKNLIDGDARAQFDRLVRQEGYQRFKQEVTNVTDDPHVKMAADAYEQGFTHMGRSQKQAETMGHARIPDSGRGYWPQLLDGHAVHRLTAEQRKNVESILSRQFQELNSYDYINDAGEKVTKAFDKPFADKLAKDYLQRGLERAAGINFVPINLHTGEGAGILQDTLRAMGTLSVEDQKAILGRFSRGGPSYTKGRLQLDLTEDLGGGVLLGDLFQKSNDVLYRSYARKAAGQIALAQHGIYGHAGIDLMRRLIIAKGADAKTLDAFNRVMAEFMNEPALVKGKYDYAFQNMRMVTAAARLGGMAFPQLAEFSNAIPALGVRGAMAAIGDLPKMVAETRAWRKGQKVDNPVIGWQDDLFGHIGGDDYIGNRIFDSRDNGVDLYDQESLSLFSRLVRAGSNVNMIMSGFRVVHAAQRRALSEQILRKAVLYIREGAEGSNKHLEDMGLNPDLQRTIRENLDSIATFDKRGKLTSFDPTGGLDSKTISELSQVIERGAGQIIQRTYVGEAGPWAHSEQLKLLLQFRTFGITSIEKQYGRNIALHGTAMGPIHAFMTMVGAMGFALPIHMARVQAQAALLDASDRKEYLDKHTSTSALARALQNYVSIMGLAPDAEDIMATIATQVDGDAPDWLKTDFGARGRVPDTGSYVPAIGYANDAMKATAGLATAAGTMVGANDRPDPGKRLVKALKLLPGSNNPAVAALFNQVSEAGPDE